MRSRVIQLATLALASLMLLAGGAMAEEATKSAGFWLNMPEGVTAVSRDVYALHMKIVWICGLIGILVFGVMFYAMIAHRKSLGVKPATFHESTLVEILWTVVPFIILIYMAFPATKTLIAHYDDSEPDIDILVTGYQWKWKYEYLNDSGEKVSFFSNLRTPNDEIHNESPKGEHYLLEVDEPLVVPVGKKVRFLITANDVIHSWWVPAIAVKKDAIPGFVNESWTRIEKEGVYRGQCAELCGKNHGFMPIVVNAVSEDEFNAWMAKKQQAAAEIRALMDQELPMEDLMARGEQVYNTSCAMCHGGAGEGTGIAPALKGSKLATGAISDHLAIVVNGKPGTAMAAYGSQFNELDIAAVVTYERNSWGNNMGDLLQPIDVANAKKGQ
jgi:cytochrome c oxidase subunit 2